VGMSHPPAESDHHGATLQKRESGDKSRMNCWYLPRSARI
jgi:hypothetical protein